jgi:DNA-binding transcriptional ArsR family regulator
MSSAGGCTKKAKANRTAETRNWKIPDKFVNDDFVSFLSVLLHLEENQEARNQRSIRGEDSVQEWMDTYQLQILHGIDLGDVLSLLRDKGYVEVHEEGNYIRYRYQNVARLVAEIEARAEIRFHTS